MTQDERRLAKYKDVRAFIETNHRNPFKEQLGRTRTTQLGSTSAEIGE